MPVKIEIGLQVEAMEAVIVAEEFRQVALVAREEITQADADLWLARLRAGLETLTWIRDNRARFISFLRAETADGGPTR